MFTNEHMDRRTERRTDRADHLIDLYPLLADSINNMDQLSYCQTSLLHITLGLLLRLAVSVPPHRD